MPDLLFLLLTFVTTTNKLTPSTTSVADMVSAKIQDAHTH
jgi:hypothetical protein